jgi:hypothetical protein
LSVAADPTLIVSRTPSRLIALSSLAIIVALVLGVGIPNHEVLRHVLQTLPFWCALILGARNSRLAVWVGLPLFVFWLLIMTLIWMSLLGISHLLGGSFSGWEIVMTIVVGSSCIAGIAASVRSRSTASMTMKAAVVLLSAAIQLTCFFTSFLPAIARR